MKGGVFKIATTEAKDGISYAYLFGNGIPRSSSLEPLFGYLGIPHWNGSLGQDTRISQGLGPKPETKQSKDPSPSEK